MVCWQVRISSTCTELILLKSAESTMRNSLAAQTIENSSQSAQEGRYDVRILFNGAWRRVPISTQLKSFY